MSDPQTTMRRWSQLSNKLKSHAAHNCLNMLLYPSFFDNMLSIDVQSSKARTLFTSNYVSIKEVPANVKENTSGSILM